MKIQKIEMIMEYFLKYQIEILDKIWKVGDVENKFIKCSSDNILKIV